MKLFGPYYMLNMIERDDDDDDDGGGCGARGVMPITDFDCNMNFTIIYMNIIPFIEIAHIEKIYLYTTPHPHVVFSTESARVLTHYNISMFAMR